MKNTFKISVLLLLYILLCGKSCNEDKDDKIKMQEKEAAFAKDSIMRAFEVDYLTEESRYAVEMSAIQKIQDFADYQNIYSNGSLDSVFRNMAGIMIRKIFISGKVVLSLGTTEPNQGSSITLEDFLDQDYLNDILRIEMAFDSIMVSEPLQRKGKELYKGTLLAYRSLTYYTLMDTIAIPSELIYINFFASKTGKNFGKDTMNIWNVALCDMVKEL